MTTCMQPVTQGNAAQFYMGFVANFILFLTVKEFSRSVKFWQSYSMLNLAQYFGTQCSSSLFTTERTFNSSGIKHTLVAYEGRSKSS